MHIEFTQAHPQHIDLIVNLVNSAYRGEGAKQGWTTEADLLGGQRLDHDLLLELIEKKDSVVLIAEDEDKDDSALVGCVHLEKQGRECHLGLLTVSPLMQNKGIGDMILDEAEAFAHFWDCEVIQIHVIVQRSELIQWYEKKGFKKTGATKPFPYGDERYGIPKRDDLSFLVLEKSL